MSDEQASYESPLLTRPEAGAYLKIGQAYLDELTASGRIPSFKLGRRRLYRRRDLDEWVELRVLAGRSK
ncbi:MAG TPA: helix-turn-helix domain-containing protein [Acidimicrobiales bacterium]|jgi:excisionase family DNA binding protein|nr:helix-turn-helix domain-containing protein [Acidimicrobiales bacterium]